MTNKATVRFLGSEQSERRFLFRWVLASVVGVIVAYFMVGYIALLWLFGMGALFEAVGWSPSQHAVDTVILPAALAGITAEIGAVIGAAQWLVLRKRVHRAGWWVLASAVGLAAATVVAGVTYVLNSALVEGARDAAGAFLGAAFGDGTRDEMLGALVVITKAGATLGAAQWLFLRTRIHRAGWWVLASAGAWAAAVVFVQTATRSQIDAGLAAVVAMPIAYVAGVLGTGAVLARLLRRPIPGAQDR